MEDIESDDFVHQYANLVMSYCPDALLTSLDESVDTDIVAKSWFRDGACMLADISGFTRLSGKLCELGVSGLDELRRITSDFLSKLLYIVYTHGGDGDALVCVFEGKDAATKSLECGLLLKDMKMDGNDELSCHIAVSYGTLCFGVLGENGSDWVFLVNGQPISDLSGCIDDASSQQLVVTKSLMNHLPSSCIQIHVNFIELPSGNYLINKFTKPEGVQENLDSVTCVLSRFQNKRSNVTTRNLMKFLPRPILSALHAGLVSNIAQLREVSTVFLKLDSYSLEANSDLLSLQPFFVFVEKELAAKGGFLRQFLVDDKGCVLIALWGVPSASYANNSYRAALFAMKMVTEARTLGQSCSAGVTTGETFVGTIGSLLRRDYAAVGDSVNMAARLMGKAHGGVFLDSRTFEELPDGLRAKFIPGEALRLKGKIAAVHPHIFNPTSNQISCSVKELSAEDINVDKANVFMDNLHPEIVLKMESEFTKMLQDYDSMRERTVRDAKAIKSRITWTKIPQSLSRLIIIQGAKAMGKTMHVKYLLNLAHQHKIRNIYLCASAANQLEDYSFIKDFIYELIMLNQYPFATDMEQRYTLERILAVAYPCMLDKSKSLKYLSDIFQFSWSSSVDLKLKMQQGKASDQVSICKWRCRWLTKPVQEDVLCSVIKVLIGDVPTVVILENCHIIDKLSRSELINLKTMQAPILCVMTEQSYDIHETYVDIQQGPVRKCICGENCLCNLRYRFNKYGVLFKNDEIIAAKTANITPRPEATKSNCVTLKIPPLSLAQTRAILVHSLDGSDGEVTDELVDVVMNACGGNPYWTYEVGVFIQKASVSTFLRSLESSTETSESRTLSSSHNSSSFNKSGRHSAKLHSRYLKYHLISVMESLSGSEIIVLKYASIFGIEFFSNIVKSIIPEKFREQFEDTLSSLESKQFISKDISSNVKYEFSTALMRQIIYDMTPPSDAKDIHLKFARQGESLPPNSRPPSSILAYHYFMAYSGKNAENVKAKVLEYSILTANAYVEQLAFQQAADFFNLAESTASSIDELAILLESIDRSIISITEVSAILKESSLTAFVLERTNSSLAELLSNNGVPTSSFAPSVTFNMSSLSPPEAFLLDMQDLRDNVQSRIDTMRKALDTSHISVVSSPKNDGKVYPEVGVSKTTRSKSAACILL